MDNAPTAPLRQQPLQRLQRLAGHLLIVTAFNTLCAVVITHILQRGSFTENLAFSLCIGTLAWLFIDGGRLLFWGDGKPAGLPFLALVLLSLPAAQMGGSLLAGWLLGMPDHPVLPTRSGHAAQILLFSVLAGLAATWFFWNRGRVAYLLAQAEAEKARAAGIERQALQAQLQLLQAQIEPHMLFNTLANLQGLIAIDPPRAQQLLDQLIQYLRAALGSSRAAATTLGQEWRLMEAYLGLMSVRMGRRLEYTLDLPAELADAPLAPMLLQPLVENAIRHGLEPKVEGGRIDISASRHQGMLALTVCDTGLGLSAPGTSGMPDGGVGLHNVRERLLALYGEAAALELAPNMPCGLRAEIRIPLP